MPRVTDIHPPKDGPLAPDAPKYVVQVRPEGAGPDTWPHRLTTTLEVHAGVYNHPDHAFIVEFQWASITAVGWSIGIDETAAVPMAKVEDRISAWMEDHEEEFWAYEYRMVKIGK